MALAGISNPTQMNLVTYDAFGNEYDNKIWGPINYLKITYETLDDVIRELNSLSKNTYGDTILKATESYNSSADTTAIGNNEGARVCINVISGTNQRLLTLDYKFWNKLNPEKTYLQAKTIFGTNDNSSIANSSLFYLIDVNGYKTSVGGFIAQIWANGNALVSVNEKIAE